MKAVDAASVLSVVIDTAASSIIAPSSRVLGDRIAQPRTDERNSWSSPTIRRALAGCAASGHTRESSNLIVTSRTATSTHPDGDTPRGGPDSVGQA